MSYWLEIHCDVQKEGRDPNDPCELYCYSHNNRNVSGWATSINHLNVQAKKAGWVRFLDGTWSCPNCKTNLKETSE